MKKIANFKQMGKKDERPTDDQCVVIFRPRDSSREIKRIVRESLGDDVLLEERLRMGYGKAKARQIMLSLDLRANLRSSEEMKKKRRAKKEKREREAQKRREKLEQIKREKDVQAGKFGSFADLMKK